jgi:hypothetical protein
VRGGWGRGARGAPHRAWDCDFRGDGLGQLKFDPATKQITAHCNFPSHGRLCRLRRTVNGNARNAAAGRPAGLLIAWMGAASSFKTYKLHQEAGGKPFVPLHAELNIVHRGQARVWAETIPELAGALAELERPAGRDEAAEPEGFA